MRDFGIEVEEEGLLIFQELVRGWALAAAGAESPENDHEVSVGVDLLVDVERVLEFVHGENVEVTREGSVYKKTEERILPRLATAAHSELFDGEPVGQVFALCRRLSFFEQDGSRVRCCPIRRRAWLRKRPLAKLREVYGVMQAESRGDRWSFHQAALREIFLDLLTHFQPGRWVSSRELFSAVLASYLLNLKDRGVDADFRRRWNEDFHHEKLMVPLEKLPGVALPPRGGQLFGIPLPPGEAGRLVVTPDFEILLFPGEREPELVLTLSQFADRKVSDRVKGDQGTAES